MKFSACWIVKNEEDNIERSIISVKNCADEIIVVDTGSTDNTVSVAKRCGARVEYFDWINDFAAVRNYALSLASGKFVIFLDADEFFHPALTAADGGNFTKLFKKTKADVFGVFSIEIEKKDDSFRDLCIRERLLRRAAVHYEGRIHETAKIAGGGDPKSVLLENYTLIHTGYSKEVVPQKMKRNLNILEEEQKNQKDPLKKYHNAIYMMREAFFLADFDKSADYFLYLLANHEYHADEYGSFPEGFLRHYYHAVHVVEIKRGKFSRKEIYDKLFRVVKERHSDIRDGMLADLHYQLRFDYRDDRFLRGVEEIEPKLPAEFPMDIPDRRFLEANIFVQAAEVTHMRGDRRRTCLYAYRSLECLPAPEGRPLLLLLYSLKDHSLKDAEMILKSAAVPGRPNVARAVIEILNTKGAREKLFNNADPIEVFPPENRRISVAGSQASESDRLAFFRMKAEQFFASMSYADIINNQDVDLTAEKDYICAYYVAYAQLMQENYIKAYNTILSHIKIGVTNQELLSILLVTAEKMREPLASEAKKLYEESISILNEVVDLNDIINTDAVYGADPEKEKHAMKIMAPSVFFEGYEKEKNKPVTELLLEKHKKAVPVFEKNGCVLMAAESYRLLLSKGLDSEKNTRALSRLFRDSENNELANQVEKLTLQNH